MNKEKFFNFCFGCSHKDITENVIITPFVSLENFSSICKIEKSFKGMLYSGKILSKNNKKLTVIKCGIGPGLMGDAVLLLGISYVKNIIFFGSCGGLKDCELSDIILGEKAFNGEGFGLYYKQDFNIKDVFLDNNYEKATCCYTEQLKKHVSKESKVKVGNIFTIGSLIAETKENLIYIENKGFLAIDMELSAVYKATEIISRNITSIMFVSDLPLKNPIWQQDLSKYNIIIKKISHILVDFIIK